MVLPWVVQENGEELVVSYGMQGEEGVGGEVYDGLACEYFFQCWAC